jgi:L,D-transpeptidase YcbB
MNKLLLSLIAVIFISSFSDFTFKRKAIAAPKSASDNSLINEVTSASSIPFDSVMVTPFYNSFPALKKYRNDAVQIYRKRQYNFIWLEGGCVTEFSHALYGKFKMLEEEGITSTFPYRHQIEGLFIDEVIDTLSETEAELILTNLFLFIADKKILGIDGRTVIDLGWLLQRKRLTYDAILDSLLSNRSRKNWEYKVLLPQYFKLRDYLQRYREIEKNGGWNVIDFDPKLKAFKPGDTAKSIVQIRQRLFMTGELACNTGSNMYDAELAAAVREYQLHNGRNPDRLITPKLIRDMNVPVGEHIRKIMINMERCRWISPEIIAAKEFIVVNIPSYKLSMYRDGKIAFESPVVVGKTITKTVIFDGNMSHIVFSPWWNLPESIIKKEVIPGIKKNPDYLADHNMEWNNGQVRQKPGKSNSLGLVKFMFPNTNDIYMHDTPQKSLFERENRAFSHGCIRVGKPRDLAIMILKDDLNWTPAKIDAAMNRGIETTYTLKNKIPVYIGYFTSWVNEQGELSFYEDIYQMDEKLEKLLIE